MEFEESDDKRMIYRSYRDTDIASLWVDVQCPYCEHNQTELDLTDCGKTYDIECDGCEKEYKMHFDA